MNFLFPQVLRSRHQVCVLFAGRSGFRQHTIMPGYGLDADPNAVAPADFLQHVEAFHGQTLHSGDSRDLLSLLFDDWPSGSVQQAPTGMRQQDVGIHASANAWHAGPTGSRAPQFLQQQHELQQTGVYEFRAQPQSLLPPADATGLQSRQQLNFSTSSAAGTHPSSGSGGSGSTPAASATAAVSSKACRGKQTKADSSEQGGSKVSRWKQSKAKMGALETQAAEAQQMANKMEGENLVLKLRALAMEHTVAAREKQVNILSEHSARRHSSGASGLSTHSSWSDPTNHAGSGGITVGLGTGQGSASASDLAIVSVSALVRRHMRAWLYAAAAWQGQRGSWCMVGNGAVHVADSAVHGPQPCQPCAACMHVCPAYRILTRATSAPGLQHHSCNLLCNCGMPGSCHCPALLLRQGRSLMLSPVHTCEN